MFDDLNVTTEVKKAWVNRFKAFEHGTAYLLPYKVKQIRKVVVRAVEPEYELEMSSGNKVIADLKNQLTPFFSVNSQLDAMLRLPEETLRAIKEAGLIGKGMARRDMVHPGFSRLEDAVSINVKTIVKYPRDTALIIVVSWNKPWKGRMANDPVNSIYATTVGKVRDLVADRPLVHCYKRRLPVKDGVEVYPSTVEELCYSPINDENGERNSAASAILDINDFKRIATFDPDWLEETKRVGERLHEQALQDKKKELTDFLGF